MKILRRATASVLAILIVFTCMAGVCADTNGEYKISNPYADVNWDTWQAYKAQLHVHTIASDGNVQLADVVEAHYALGYDILAITDHATCGVEWTQAPQLIPLFRLVKYERTQMSDIVTVTPERYEQITTGSDRDGRGMLDVPTGIEMNGAVPSNSHINGYFTDGYGQGLLGVDGDYETPAAQVDARGGITFLNHIGNYLEYNNNDNAEKAVNNPFYINKFASIFVNYPSCLGMDVNSGTNNHTKYDIRLYDNVLHKTIPYGVTPWCYAFSDAHGQEQWDRAFTVHMLPELSVDSWRESMENGTFFAVGRHARLRMGDNWQGEYGSAYPMVTGIKINEKLNTITLTCADAQKVFWVADGKDIQADVSTDETGNTMSCTLDIDDYYGMKNGISTYVRAEILGEGGICYVQPITITEKGTVPEHEDISNSFDPAFALRALVEVLNVLLFGHSGIVTLFKSIALGQSFDEMWQNRF